MKSSHPGLRNVPHAIDRPAVDMKAQGNRDLIDELRVHVAQKVAVVLSTYQVASGMIGQSQGVGAGLDLRSSKIDWDLAPTIQTELGLARVVKRHQEKLFHSETVVPHRPGTHCLADDGNFVSKFLAESFNRL